MSASQPAYATPHARWRALATRDPRAHTAFVYAVRSTRIYCRPTCPGRLARRANVDFYDTAAAAAAAALPGYRACKRCRPDVDHGSCSSSSSSSSSSGSGHDGDGCGEDVGGRRAAERARGVLEREGGEVVWREVAGEVGRAPRYLHGVFRAAFGVTPGVHAAGVKKRRREEKEGGRGAAGAAAGAGVVSQEELTPELVEDEGSSSGGASGSGAEMVEDWGDLFADMPGLCDGGTVDLNEACAVEGMQKLFDGASLEPWEHLVQWDAAAFPSHTIQDTGKEGAAWN